MTRLEQLRVNRALTPEQLGELCEVSGVTIRRIEAGHRARPATLTKLARYFDVPASDLYRDALPVDVKAA